MQPFSAFGFLLVGFLTGVVVCLFLGLVSGVYLEARSHIKAWTEQEMELRRVREKHKCDELSRLVDRLAEEAARKNAILINAVRPPGPAPFPVKNPCTPSHSDLH